MIHRKKNMKNTNNILYSYVIYIVVTYCIFPEIVLLVTVQGVE